MKAIQEKVYDISKYKLSEKDLTALLRDINLKEGYSAYAVGNKLNVTKLVEEVDQNDKTNAQETDPEIEDVLNKYSQVKDKEPIDKEDPDMEDEEKFIVIMDPIDINKLKTVNAAGMELAVTNPATVEVKESQYSKFINECSKNNLKIKRVGKKPISEATKKYNAGKSDIILKGVDSRYADHSALSILYKLSEMDELKPFKDQGFEVTIEVYPVIPG